MDNASEFLTTACLARLLHVEAQTLRKYRMSGRGPRYTKVGSKILYRRVDVDAWLDSNTVDNTAQP